MGGLIEPATDAEDWRARFVCAFYAAFLAQIRGAGLLELAEQAAADCWADAVVIADGVDAALLDAPEIVAAGEVIALFKSSVAADPAGRPGA